MKRHLLIIIVLSAAWNFHAGFAQVDVKTDINFKLLNTEAKLFPSQNVADTFHILISLPRDYSETNKTYPVFYVLDGDVSLGMAAGIARYLEIGRNIPELIVVGIGYGSLKKSDVNKRNRDYRPGSGGAEKFPWLY